MSKSKDSIKEEVYSEKDVLLNALLEYFPGAIYFKDLESRFIRVSKSMARLFDLDSPDELKGKTDFDFFDKEHAQPAFDDEQNIIKTSKSVEDLIEKEVFMDGSVRYVSTTKLPLKDSDGGIIGTFGISQDVTERILAQEQLARSQEELKEMVRFSQEKLIESEKMSSMWHLTSGMTAELDGPVAQMRSSIEKLQNQLKGAMELLDLYRAHESEEKIKAFEKKIDFEQSKVGIDENLMNVFIGAESSAVLLGELKKFASKYDSDKENESDLHEVINNTLKMIDTKIGEGIKLTMNYDNQIGKIAFSEDQLKKALINIIINATEAIKDKGTINITTSIDDEVVYISIKDTGVGMNEEAKSKAFNPFFTTKFNDEGAGLGLSISYGIIARHGGQILIESEEGKGTDVKVVIPLIN